MNRFSSGFSLIEILISLAILAIGFLACATLLRWTTEISSDIGEVSIVEKNLDDAFRWELDAARHFLVSTDDSNSNSVKQGACVWFFDRDGKYSKIYQTSQTIVLRRESQSPFMLCTAGVTNLLFDVTTGTLKVTVGTDQGTFYGNYEHRAAYKISP